MKSKSFSKVIFLLVALIISSESFAERKKVDVDWGRKGFDIDFPEYNYKARSIKSGYRTLEKQPVKYTKQGFKAFDKAINKKLKKLF